MLLAAAFMLAAQFGMAQDAALKADAVKFMEVSGIAKSYENIVTEVIKNVPAEKQADFKKELNVSIKNLTAKMADLYAASLSQEDLKALIKFYESPAGKKMVATSNSDAFTQKTKEFGQEFGMEVQGMMMKYME